MENFPALWLDCSSNFSTRLDWPCLGHAIEMLGWYGVDAKSSAQQTPGLEAATSCDILSEGKAKLSRCRMSGIKETAQILQPQRTGASE